MLGGYLDSESVPRHAADSGIALPRPIAVATNELPFGVVETGTSPAQPAIGIVPHMKAQSSIEFGYRHAVPVEIEDLRERRCRRANEEQNCKQVEADAREHNVSSVSC